MDDDVTTASKLVTNITQECEKGEGSKSITTIAETDVDENTSSKDIQVQQTVTYRKSTKGAKYIPVKKGRKKIPFLFLYSIIYKC